MVSHINFGILFDIKAKYNLFNINDNDNDNDNNNISLNIRNDITEKQNKESISHNIENIENKENKEKKIKYTENNDISNNLDLIFEKLQVEVIQSLKKYTKNKNLA